MTDLVEKVKKARDDVHSLRAKMPQRANSLNDWMRETERLKNVEAIKTVLEEMQNSIGPMPAHLHPADLSNWLIVDRQIKDFAQSNNIDLEGKGQ